MSDLKIGDHVRFKHQDKYYYGDVTIIKDNGTAKVMFNDLNYDYYPIDELDIMLPEHSSEYMIISREELQKLDDYFCNRAGYISQEFDEAVHTFIGKMNRVLRNPL